MARPRRLGYALLVMAVRAQTHGPAVTKWLELGDCGAAAALVLTPNTTDHTMRVRWHGAGHGTLLISFWLVPASIIRLSCQCHFHQEPSITTIPPTTTVTTTTTTIITITITIATTTATATTTITHKVKAPFSQLSFQVNTGPVTPIRPACTPRRATARV